MSYRQLNIREYARQQVSAIGSVDEIAASETEISRISERLRYILKASASQEKTQVLPSGTLYRPYTGPVSKSNPTGLLSGTRWHGEDHVPFSSLDKQVGIALRDSESLTAISLVGSLSVYPMNWFSAMQVQSVGESTISVTYDGRELVSTRKIRGETWLFFDRVDVAQSVPLIINGTGVLSGLQLRQPSPHSGGFHSIEEYRIPVGSYESFFVRFKALLVPQYKMAGASSRWSVAHKGSEIELKDSGIKVTLNLSEGAIHIPSRWTTTIGNYKEIVTDRVSVNPQMLGNSTDPIFTSANSVLMEVSVEAPHVVISDVLVDYNPR